MAPANPSNHAHDSSSPNISERWRFAYICLRRGIWSEVEHVCLAGQWGPRRLRSFPEQRGVQPSVLQALGSWPLPGVASGSGISQEYFSILLGRASSLPLSVGGWGFKGEPRAAPGGCPSLARTRGVCSPPRKETGSSGLVPCAGPPAEPAAPAHQAGEQTEAREAGRPGSAPGPRGAATFPRAWLPASRRHVERDPHHEYSRVAPPCT